MSPQLRAELLQRGGAAWLADQLNPAGLDDSAVDAALAGFATLGRTNSQNADIENLNELRHAAVLRALLSRRQLFEIMVDFWNNHFNVALDDDGRWRHLKIRDEAEVGRANALGSFTELLKASARSPAMLVYLDNYKSNASSPQGLNENYGRELLELHTLGIVDDQQVYTEADVIAASQVMSGWSVDTTDRRDLFQFKPQLHFTGPISLLSGAWSTPGRTGAAAMADGDSLLEFLARHPSTARHLAYKLVKRFVSDEPPAGLVASAAQVYLQNGTAIAPVLRHILTSPEFAASAGAKVRRPFELLMAMLRGLGATLEVDPNGPGAESVRQQLNTMGQALYSWPSPDGYPDHAGHWLSSFGMQQRWAAGGRLAGNTLNGISYDPAQILPGTAPATAADVVDRVVLSLLDAAPSAPERQALLGAFGRAAADPAANLMTVAALRPLVGVVLAMPASQLR